MVFVNEGDWLLENARRQGHNKAYFQNVRPHRCHDIARSRARPTAGHREIGILDAALVPGHFRWQNDWMLGRASMKNLSPDVGYRRR